MPRTAATAAILILAAGTLTGLPGGCAARPALQTQAPPTARADLERLDASPPSRPPHALPAALELPGLVPVDAADPKATATLADALAALAPENPEPAAAASPAPSQADAAIRLYTAGRLDLEAGRTADAVEHLRAAAEADPSSHQIWSALGEAYYRSGSARSADAAFARAATLGSRDPVTLFSIARSAQARSDHAAAARALAQLLGDDAGGDDAPSPSGTDPAVPHVARVALGQSLIALGYLSAGAEVLARGLDLPARFTHPTSYQQELGEVYRRRAELWRITGDTYLRLSRPVDALDAYTRAASFPTLDTEPLLPRRMRAALLAGRPGAAALALLDEVTQPSNRPDDAPDLRSLAAALAQADGRAARLLARALLAELPAPPTRASLLTRIAAAAMPVRDAAATLRSHLAGDPADRAALADLLALDPARADRTLADLAAAAPLDIPEIAAAAATPGLTALAPGFPAPADLAAALDRDTSHTSVLLAAHLRAHTGLAADQDAALQSVAALRAQRPDDPAVALSAALLGARAGRWDLALPAIDALRKPGAPPLALAHALAAAQRLPEALDAATAAAEQPDQPGSARAQRAALLAAELAIALERYEDAERLLRAIIETDPTQELAYIPLLRMHKGDGGIPDEAKLGELVRALRAAVPAGRALRMLRAEEFAATGRLGLAQAELLTLAEQDPLDDDPLELLASAWRDHAPPTPSAAAPLAQEAEKRLRPLLEQTPRRISAAVALAAAQRAAGDSETAEATLRAALDPDGGPREVAIELAETLRRAGRLAEAEALTAARLARTPDAIPTLVETAWRALGEGDVPAAADALKRLPAGALLTPAQVRALAPAVERICRETAPSRDADERAAARAIAEALIAVSHPSPHIVHGALLMILLTEQKLDADAIKAALANAVAEHPSAARIFYGEAAAYLAATDRALALQVVQQGAAVTDPPSPDLHTLWAHLAAQVGEPADAIAALEAIESAGLVSHVLAAIRADARADSDDNTPDTPAQLAYRLGIEATTAGRDATAIALYEACLQRDPRHGWACNNLGYTLLERDGPTDRVAALLETAYELLPDEAHILDSIGWLRYRRGMLDDEPGATPDDPLREGAVTLLRRSIERGGDPPSVVAMDHLGDALWMSGQFDEALRAWRAAGDTAQQYLAALRSLRGQPGVATEIRRFQALATALRDKQLTALRGQRPAVVPVEGLEVPTMPIAAPAKPDVQEPRPPNPDDPEPGS